jgi:hypothetical protein
MPETTTTVRWTTVHLPEGGWGQVKIVRADGFKPWRMRTGGVIVLVAYFAYRLFLRLRWRLDRDRRWEVRIYRIPEVDAQGNSRWEQSAHPLFRSPQPTKADALAEAIRIVEELRAGRRCW